ncbi:MAG: hypothetical protein J6S67_11640 [Methanobrevibacter sp.]|nr:hypothetical protein [Methanobrevibacter sp.]
MAVITPNTDLYLLKVPLEIDSVNQLTFSDATAQYNYFSSLPKLGVDDFTYQRKDNTIRFSANFDDVITYNYCMYRNTEYSDKWFYAFIEDMQYVNDSVTLITIKTDVWQTWCFSLNYKPVFVEREHVNDDTIGLHTVPENLELGEYIVNGDVINTDLSPSSSETNATWICFQVSDYPLPYTDLASKSQLNPSLGNDVKGKIYGGVYSGLTYLFVLTPSDANDLIKCYDLDGKSDAIVSIFQVPLGVLSSDKLSLVNYTSTAGNMTIGTMTSDDYNPISVDSATIAKPISLNNYVPKCNKMYTFPFTYLYASNNSGVDTEYHWEDFNGNPHFQIDGVISQGMSIKAYPTNYKYTSGLGGYNYGINCGKFPICAWNTDYYVNWCTQNAINQPMSIASSLVNAGLGMTGSVVSGNALGFASSLTSGLEGVMNAIDRQYQASLVPDQARGNQNAGDINMAEKRFAFTFYPMSIKAEYARICDQFMSMYGYRVNTVKVPNITGRRNWNYVKTIGCYIDADIPQTDLDEIKSLFNNGVTFWHNPATFADYTQNNDII